MMVGVQFALAVIIGLAIGYYLDQKFNTFPWLTLFWLVIGFLAGLKNVYKELKKVTK